MNIFSPQELQRYARHFNLPQIGMAGQAKLKQAKVLVIGAGGLGCPVLLYLAAAGIGQIGIVDDDLVDESNLQRQVLYSTADVGRPKVRVAKEKIVALNPHIQVITHEKRLVTSNVMDIIADYDIVVDGTDNFATRYLVNDACVLAKKILVYGSISQFEGQVAVLNYPNADGVRSANYRDLFPEPPTPDAVPNCADGGVLGVLPGIIGSLQANEVLKIVAQIGEPLVNQIFLFDALSFTTRKLRIKKRLDTKIEQLPNILDYCITKKEITAEELKLMIARHEDFQLIDVREVAEYEAFNLNGTLIPLGQLRSEVHRIERNKKVIIHCKTGWRSQQAIQLLENEFGFNNLYQLKGGITAWQV